MSITGLITGGAAARQVGIGLLVLRIFAGASLFLEHGLEKLTGYSTMVQHVPDPIHLGPQASLAYALLSDGICSILVVLGVTTRAASTVILINLLTVFFIVHHAQFFTSGHVELVWVYIGAFLALAFTGPGQFSIDARLATRNDPRQQTS